MTHHPSFPPYLPRTGRAGRGARFALGNRSNGHTAPCQCARGVGRSWLLWQSVTIVVSIAVMSAAITPSVLGAPATPTASPAPRCTMPARSRTDLAELLADRDIATPAASTSGQTLPAGTPADTETAAAMEHITRMWLACQNAGEQLRAWALFSDGYLYRLLSRQGMPDAIDTAPATPDAEAAGGARIVEIRGQRVLPDGRYGATVTIAYPSVPMPKTFFFFFTEIDGRLVIDGILGEISFSVP